MKDIIVISSDHEPDDLGGCSDRNSKKLQNDPKNGTSLTFGKEEQLPSPGGDHDGEPNFFDTNPEDLSTLCDIPEPEIEWDLRDDEYLQEEVEDTMFESQVICGTDLRTEDTTWLICFSKHVNMCLDASSCVVDPPIPFASSSTQPHTSKTEFSILMSGHEENKVWKEATEAENQRGKVLQDMFIAVDAFRHGKIPGVTAQFLSYGLSAGDMSRMTGNTIRNVSLVYVDVRGVGRRALLKRAEKAVAKAQFAGRDIVFMNGSKDKNTGQANASATPNLKGKGIDKT